MSEYTPITGELRAAMRQWGWFESDGSITFVSSPMPPSIDAEKALAISGSDFDRLCDAIDSIHAQLERENAALKAELDRVLGEQEEHAPDTWERIIEDAIGEGMARQRNNDSGNFCERANPMNNGDLVARCKALCERTKEEDE